MLQEAQQQTSAKLLLGLQKVDSSDVAHEFIET